MRPAVQKKKKKSLRVSESLPVVQQQTHIRPISWSKPIRDSEGRTPLWLAVVQIFLYVCVRLKMRALQSERERWVVEIDSVANLARFSAFLDPHSERLRGAARSVKTVIIASLILHAK